MNKVCMYIRRFPLMRSVSLYISNAPPEILELHRKFKIFTHYCVYHAWLQSIFFIKRVSYIPYTDFHFSLHEASDDEHGGLGSDGRVPPSVVRYFYETETF